MLLGNIPQEGYSRNRTFSEIGCASLYLVAINALIQMNVDCNCFADDWI